jgi:hypothetical protein
MIYLLIPDFLDNDDQTGSVVSSSALGTSEDSFDSWGSSFNSDKDPPIPRKPPPPSVNNQHMQAIEELVAQRNNLAEELNRWYNAELVTGKPFVGEYRKELERREKLVEIANGAVNHYRACIGLPPMQPFLWKRAASENHKNNKEKKS